MARSSQVHRATRRWFGPFSYFKQRKALSAKKAERTTITARQKWSTSIVLLVWQPSVDCMGYWLRHVRSA
jgi:hypothetical protein